MSIDWPLVRWFRHRPEPVIEYDEFWTRYGDTLSAVAVHEVRVLGRACPLTITDDGRIFGHIAPKEFHDGGTLDLGVVRESLIADGQTEKFEETPRPVPDSNLPDGWVVSDTVSEYDNPFGAIGGSRGKMLGYNIYAGNVLVGWKALDPQPDSSDPRWSRPVLDWPEPGVWRGGWQTAVSTFLHHIEPSPYRFTFGEEAENIARLAATARANQRPADRPNEYETFVECFPSWPSCDPGGGVTIGVIRNEPRTRRIDLEGVSCE